MTLNVREILHTAAYLPTEMDKLLDPKYPSFIKFDPELGYTLKDYVFRDGIANTLSAYSYEPHGGHRKMINYAGQPCRINTYGNSFTQCAQVSDGETWQEILAAHLREPVRNFGVGGYGVYQAYLVALRTEAIADLSAEYIILNIWDDDHVRNLDAARWIRVAWMHKDMPRGGGKDTYPIHGFPWAHVRYDLKKADFVELPGLCKNEDDLRKLADRDYYYNFFKDDQIVRLFTLASAGEAMLGELEALAEALDLKVDLRDPQKRPDDAQRLHIAYGVKSTKHLLNKMNKLAQAQGKKLMVVLSYHIPTVRDFIQKTERFDQELLDYLNSTGITYVDSLAKAGQDYKQYNLDVDAFLDRFYVSRAGAQVFGHWNPYGNFWFAFCIKDQLVNWLNPKPPAYIGSSAD